MNLSVAITVLVQLVAAAEGIVIGPVHPTKAADYENCSDSVKLVPRLRIHSLTYPHYSTSTFPTLTLPPTATPPQPLLQAQLSTTPAATTQHTHTSTTTTPTNSHLRFSKPSQLTTSHTRATTPHVLKLLKKTSDSPTEHHPLNAKSSSASPAHPSLPVNVTVANLRFSPYTSTLPPPSPAILSSPTLPPPPTTPTPKLTLQEVSEKLKDILGTQVPLTLQSTWGQIFHKSYLERIRLVNHEMVDKILQTEAGEDYSGLQEDKEDCALLQKRQAYLLRLQQILVLFLQALPQSLEEVEETAWNPEIIDYIFRPGEKAIFDVYECRKCYARDPSGVCRPVFYCKDNNDVFSVAFPRRTSRG